MNTRSTAVHALPTRGQHRRFFCALPSAWNTDQPKRGEPDEPHLLAIFLKMAQTNARILPWLSYMCHVRNYKVPNLNPEPPIDTRSAAVHALPTRGQHRRVVRALLSAGNTGQPKRGGPEEPHFVPVLLGPGMHPTPYTPHPTPHTLHPTPYTLHLTPHTLHPTPHTRDIYLFHAIGTCI